jgi:DNA repair protein RecN (Recombination protein N)
MLRRLLIRDFVIVDRLELEFTAGFGALTGETGAGKSILLDALGLALGGRAEAGMVRHGRDKADVTAEFDLPPGPELAAWLAEQAVPDEEGVLLVRRTVEAGGRSRAWINGVAATLGQLRELGEHLADIHGQHAHHALVRADTQRQLVDAQAGATALAAEVAALYRRWQHALAALRGAEQDRAAAAREREILAWQVRELEDLAFEPAAWEGLNAEHGRLAHAASLLEGSDEALAALGEGDYAVAPLLDRLVGRLAGLAGYDPRLADIQELVSAAAISAGEAVHELRRYRDRLELDPSRLAEVEGRIAAVTDVARKHRVAPEELPELLAGWRDRLAELTRQCDPEALAREVALAESAYRSAAGRLSALRVPAARALGEAVSAAMQSLAMAGGRFEVALPSDQEGSAAGLETVEFQVAANPNQPLRPLGRVASGGELSRIGLAIQVITSRNAATPTLIFDEVDVGIGGGVAEIVGRLLRQLGEERQVLCVTHLPQVAAQAHWQWSIAKERRGEEVLSQVRALDRDGRIEEIARMLGGVTITGTTREHAAEMLGLPMD